MPKLLIAIVHEDDIDAATDALRDHGTRFTRIPTIGGFLGEPNETFLMAVEDDLVDRVLEVLDKACSSREVEVPLVLLERLHEWRARTVAHGGVTVFVADLERIVKL
jgi:uncharacterized protein YaaQ